MRNAVGLFIEEYGPRTERQLGTSSRAFSQVLLIGTALNLLPAESKLVERLAGRCDLRGRPHAPTAGKRQLPSGIPSDQVRLG